MIFLDTNVVAESLKKEPDEAVMAWLKRFDVELALSTVVIAKIAYGVQKIRPDERSLRLERGFSNLRQRFADRIYLDDRGSGTRLWRDNGDRDAARASNV